VSVYLSVRLRVHYAENLLELSDCRRAELSNHGCRFEELAFSLNDTKHDDGRRGDSTQTSSAYQSEPVMVPSPQSFPNTAKLGPWWTIPRKAKREIMQALVPTDVISGPTHIWRSLLRWKQVDDFVSDPSLSSDDFGRLQNGKKRLISEEEGMRIVSTPGLRVY
jgi:hypothetical protein